MGSSGILEVEVKLERVLMGLFILYVDKISSKKRWRWSANLIGIQTIF